MGDAVRPSVASHAPAVLVAVVESFVLHSLTCLVDVLWFDLLRCGKTRVGGIRVNVPCKRKRACKLKKVQTRKKKL